MITGDKNLLRPGMEAYRRLELQRSMCERLEVVYWGRDSLLPRIPKGSFDVITAQDPFWRGHLAWHISRLKRAKLNIQVHTDLNALSWWKRAFARLQLGHADCVRVVSEKIKKQVEHTGVKVPISVLPIYIDIERFRSVMRRPHEGKNVLWIGRFEEEKDPMAAIEMFKVIIKDVPEAQLVMLGKGSLERELKGSVMGLPVTFPGWDNPVTYLETADVVISTSKHESWGASIVEALAAGVPVVALDIGIAGEAGANVVSRENLAAEVAKVLQSSQKGELKLHLPTAEEWAMQWHADISACCRVDK